MSIPPPTQFPYHFVPSQLDTECTIYESDGETDPQLDIIDEWVHRIEQQTTVEMRLKAIAKIPKANVGIKDIFDRTNLGDRLEDCFTQLSVREIKAIIAWMNLKLNPKDFEETFDTDVLQDIKIKTSPLKFLFDVLMDSLDKKCLLNDFYNETEFCDLNETFALLLTKGLINL